MIATDAPVSFRLATQTDYPFVFACWLSSVKATTAAKLTPPAIYAQDQTNLINYLIKSGMQIFICHLDSVPDEPSQTLLSFIAYQYLPTNLIIHYAFTKSPFRNNHFQSHMLNLINILHQPIILTSPPDKHILKQLQQTNNVFYDHYFFTRKFYNETT